MKKGDLVKWSGKKRFCDIKTNSIGIIVRVHPFRYIPLDYDVRFANNITLTCHKDDLKVMK